MHGFLPPSYLQVFLTGKVIYNAWRACYQVSLDLILVIWDFVETGITLFGSA